MKRIITLLALAASVATASATDFTDSLQVTVNGTTTGQKATISVEPTDNGLYTIALKNFALVAEGQEMGIGTIEVSGASSTVANGVTTLVANQVVQIKEGDTPGFWMGPMLGDIPVSLVAEQRGDQLYTVINIDLQATLSKVIKVVFGSGDYQIANSDFEAFHKEGTIDEPNHWHSFASSKGTLSGFVKGTPHTYTSTETRPGSTGSHSVKVTSASVFGVVANGTITTGQMNAGAISATDPGNHAEIDLSSTNKDSNGDPFYAKMNGRPDSLAVWVRFTQGTPNAAHPYATVSAAVTDGTYYQEPQDKTYTNLVGKASNRTIATTGDQWQRLSIPFVYDNTALTPAAILVTISTNADPGQGSATDVIYVDDLSLVYNQDITVNGISVLGQNLTVADNMEYNTAAAVVLTDSDFVVNTNAAKVIKTLVPTADGNNVLITVASQDLQSFKTYTISTKNKVEFGVTNGIGQVQTGGNAPTAIYNLQGQRVSTMTPGQVYIISRDGRNVKVIAQ